MGIEPFESYNRFDLADNPRRESPGRHRQRALRCRAKASDLRTLAANCTQIGVRDAFLDLARTYDGLANEGDASPEALCGALRPENDAA
jgi:hypothetical protein